MKKSSTILLFILLLFFSNINFANAQHYVVKGKLVDKQMKSVEFATASLLKNDSLITQTYTDSLGIFNIKANSGKYTLLIESFGQEFLNKTIDLHQDIDLGIIEIEESVILEELTISARKKLIERKVDRLVFNVENSISASGGTAIDALKITPRVKILNENVGIIGKSSVSVMVNDKMILLNGSELSDYLKTIKTEDIQLIEVITNPPAKYSAEGNSGLINIKLKQVKVDYWSASLRSSYSYNEKADVFSSGGSFNYNKGKFGISSSLGYSRGDSFNLATEEIDYPDQFWSGTTSTLRKNNSISGKLNLNYEFSSKFSSSIEYYGSESKPGIEQQNQVLLTDKNDINANRILTDLRNSKKNKNHSLSFNSLLKLDTIGGKLTIGADYFNFDYRNDQSFITKYFELPVNNQTGESILSNNGKQRINNYTLRADVEQKLFDIDLSYGARLSNTKTISKIYYGENQDGELPVAVGSNDNFKYSEAIQALYLSGKKSFNDNKWELQLGVRMESTQTEGTSESLERTDKNSYLKFFPTAYIVYNANEDHTFSLNYGKRINRPRFAMLNPFRIYNNSFSYFEGNPFLRPSYSHNIELGHSAGNFNTSVYYSKETDGYTILTVIDDQSINQQSTMLNYFTTYNYGISESFSYRNNWLESFLMLDIYYSKTISDNPNTNKITKGFGSDISVSNALILNKNKTFLANVDLAYSFPSYYGISKNREVFNLNIGVRKMFFEKKLVANLSVRDVFGTNKQRWSETINSVNIRRSNFEYGPNFSLSVSYRFGNSKIRAKQNTTGNSEEKDRATNN
ncbi:TonB-dependent receptor [Empedobacter brevis NBRC 14943 = ATCC 43319]|uniref:TonB-dependent receptor n=1 Tax=Empedobacter brevis NBRC 14943 = ATCC 43319 TaxID=1218108 RepID=A0A511NKH9_9FLAO|nr:outer membrane beta-barrel family protein [Empedobacter brevis]GEM52741.1 TonB-dependent receptor [Empedobacter brevis NBRC 14943 = ATCC 43319]